MTSASEQTSASKPNCKCTGPWDCQCKDVVDKFYNATSPQQQPQAITELWKVGGTNENYGNLRQYSTAIFNEIECVGRSLAHSYDECIKRAELIASAPQLRAEVDKLQKFKDYVHKRLDDAGVPVDPESRHKAAGCRIGGRLDLVLGQPDELSKAQERIVKFEVAQKGNLARLDQLNATIKAIWEVLEIPSSLILLETANGTHLIEFIKGLKQENNELRKLTDELLKGHE